MIYMVIDLDEKKCAARLWDETGHILDELKLHQSSWVSFSLYEIYFSVHQFLPAEIAFPFVLGLMTMCPN